jgi:2,3-bisphosphoglycerate-dependent phosphoglycerate mutase
VSGPTGREGAQGVLRLFPPSPGASRIVLIRHGEAVCNVESVVGGLKGCTGLTDLGRRQVAALVGRLEATGELREATALYSSVLPRATETAELLRGVVGPAGMRPEVRQRAGLNELLPGQSDGLTWQQVVDTFGVPDWDADETRPIAPEGESWSTFVPRASAAVRDLADRHRGELVVAAVHAGVIEATMIAFLGVPRQVYRRGWLRIQHASMTKWEWVPSEDRWILLRFNDAYGVPQTADRVMWQKDR